MQHRTVMLFPVTRFEFERWKVCVMAFQNHPAEDYSSSERWRVEEDCFRDVLPRTRDSRFLQPDQILE